MQFVPSLMKDISQITKIKKADDKFYISDIKKAVPVLFEHGFNVTKGRVRPIK